MANIIFKLGKHRVTAESTSIIMNVSHREFKGGRFIYGTGEKVRIKYWGKNKVKEVGNYALDARLINGKLNDIEVVAIDYFNNKKKNNDRLSHIELKHKLDIALGRVEEIVNGDKQKPFLVWAEDLLDNYSHNLKKTTIRQKKQSVSRLQEFANKTKRVVDFLTIDYKLFAAFVSWLESRGLSQNTIWGHSKNIKSLLSEAENKHNIDVCKDYRKGLFMVKQVETDKIYLNEKQLEEIEKLDLGHLPDGYEKSRNLFLLGAYTGLRIGDLISLKKENFIKHEEKDYIKVKQKKTGKEVLIPLKKSAKRIGLPKPYADINTEIKIIAKMAKIKEWRQVSSHTARRSFATNLYKRGAPAYAIMALTGHKTESSFLRYIRISQAEHAISLIDHEYFN